MKRVDSHWSAAALPDARPADGPVGRSTIRDVARVANVSRMTVSRALKEPDLVKAETRQRILDAVAELAYVPDRAAGSLSTRRTGFVGLVLPTLTNATFAMVAHGLTEVLKDEDFHLLIGYSRYSLEEEENQIRNLLERRPEAIVLFNTVHSRAATAMLMREEVPVIEVADCPERAIQHAVGYSNYNTGRTAARYLIGRGFRRIGALGSLPLGDRADHRGESRIRGFEDELRLNGLSTDHVLRQGDAPVCFEHGGAAIASLLDRTPDLEAVFCVSDLCAVGAIMECQRRGIDVPNQLSVMGFGDFDIGRVINPALTTLRVDFFDIGRRAGQLALDLLSNKTDPAPKLFDVDISLIERASVAQR